MNATRQLILAAVFAAVGAGANAQEATPDTWLDTSLTNSRAQVQAELIQARKDGSIKAWSAGYMPKIESVKSREQVRAETAAARSSGELAAIDAVVYDHVPPQRALIARSVSVTAH